jgi:hypothetical protein
LRRKIKHREGEGGGCSSIHVYHLCGDHGRRFNFLNAAADEKAIDRSAGTHADCERKYEDACRLSVLMSTIREVVVYASKHTHVTVTIPVYLTWYYY